MLKLYKARSSRSLELYFKAANKADDSCGMAMYHAGHEDYYCTDSENEYVFKYKEEAE